MATHLDLQEQEQLDELKAFWRNYGNLITWTLTLVLAAFAAWNGWNWWQGKQAVQASAMFDELDRVVQAGDADKANAVFNDLKERYGSTAYAQQAGLLTAKLQLEKGKADAAQATLGWVADKAGDDEYRALAHLRLAGLLLDKKAYDEALKQLDAVSSPTFLGLVEDRRGDVLLAQGKKPEAIKAYQAAWKAMDAQLEYRRIVDAKLTSLGAAPEADKPASGSQA
ncbi:MAG TPA: tetratricopeptide repeat protein [Ideonella sp.]|nr:tetratricopeptide repeat protein [Ideonella sp.]